MLIVEQIMSLADLRCFTNASLILEGWTRLKVRENQSEKSPCYLQGEFMVHLAYFSFGNQEASKVVPAGILN